MNVFMRVRIRRSLLARWLGRYCRRDRQAVMQQLSFIGEAILCPTGAKVVNMGHGWYSVIGYHYAGDDVKGVKQMLEQECNELGFEARACGDEPPKMTIHAYVDGKRANWW